MSSLRPLDHLKLGDLSVQIMPTQGLVACRRLNFQIRASPSFDPWYHLSFFTVVPGLDVTLVVHVLAAQVPATLGEQNGKFQNPFFLSAVDYALWHWYSAMR